MKTIPTNSFHNEVYFSKVDFDKLIGQWKGSVAITAIGVVNDSLKVEIKTVDGKIEDLPAMGFDHLSRD